MRSKPPKGAVEHDLFRQELVNIINVRHDFRHELPCDPLSLVRWRKRIGKAGAQVAADADESRIRNLARKPINLPPLFRTPSHITPWIRGFDSTGGHDASLPMPQDYRRGPPRSYCITLPRR